MLGFKRNARTLKCSRQDRVRRPTNSVRWRGRLCTVRCQQLQVETLVALN